MGKVYFIGAGPGDPELLTVKGLKLLKKCGVVIYAGSLINKEFLSFTTAKELYDSSKLNLNQIISIMEQAINRGLDVARLHSGDPSVYGAIAEQINELKKRSIEYEVIPGISAAFAAAASLGVELTAPQISQTILISRVEGRTPMPEGEDLSRIAKCPGTVCLYLSVNRIEEISKAFLKHRKPDTAVAVCYKVSWDDEMVVKGTLADISKKVKQKGINRQAVVIIGEALKENIQAYSKLYDEKFSHGFRD
ncbi:precorrin-4 C(11)-methyltransferase [Hippea maritima]|uniref:Precorrin-4 C11-methyltransferase n=1 Tax=Hippea maritima (strain ATCC 700847 / DSM 10411 / MH2) TaxID=760142 RepID=F2LU87_HIPMA|nr:precorrin-4 C(11)-methyltransferase [Hippea maritima]AEA34550.1 precorrin-4 C11-methyltransferase [Hippea maritima DSM 10411]